MSKREFLICYWAALLCVPLCLVNLVMFIWGAHSIVSLFAAICIAGMGMFNVRMGEGTAKARQSIRESEAWLNAYYERHGR